MAMTKGKMLACGAGGVFTVAVAVLGWLLFDAYSTRTEQEEALEEEMASFQKFNKAAVFPSVQAIADVNSNCARYVAWTKAAQDRAAQGDKAFVLDEAPSAFKQRLANEVRRLGNLPGGVEGHLAATGFFFGFDKYLGESAVLPEAADVPTLTVQLDTITRFSEMFAKAGVLEMKEVVRQSPVAATKDEEEQPRKGRGKKKIKNQEEESASKMTTLDYKLSFLARPAAFVEALNGLVADNRFVVIKKLEFHLSADTIVDKLNAVEAALQKKNEDKAGGRSRRRRNRAAAEEPVQETAPKGDDRLVVDPELDAPVLVSMAVTVYDFGRAVVASAGETVTPAAVPADKKEVR